MRQFKARVERPVGNWHAMEIWLEANNIVDAGQNVMDILSPLGVISDNVTKLVEVSKDDISLKQR